MLGGWVEAEVSKYSGRKVKREKVWKYENRTIGSFIELRMVGESYEATSWRSGPVIDSVDSVEPKKKVEHVNTGVKGSSG